MRRLQVLAAVAMLALGLSGCGLLGGEPATTPTATPGVRSAPTATPTTVPKDNTGGERPYVVEEDDTLWIIAEKVYGDGSLYMKIYEANKDQLADPEATLDVGMVLKIPD